MAETLTNTNGAMTLKQGLMFNRLFWFGTISQTVTVNISKNGAAFGAAAGAVSEVGGAGNGNGWYQILLNTSDVNTLGTLAYHCTAASGGPVDFVDLVSGTIIGDIQITANGNVIATNAIRQNVAFGNFPFIMTKAGIPIPSIGGTITAQRNLNGAGFAPCANSGTYIDAGNGIYYISLLAADLNGTSVVLRFTSPSADDNDVIVFPSP